MNTVILGKLFGVALATLMIRKAPLPRCFVSSATVQPLTRSVANNIGSYGSFQTATHRQEERCERTRSKFLSVKASNRASRQLLSPEYSYPSLRNVFVKCKSTECALGLVLWLK